MNILEWHNCDGKIGLLFRKAIAPLSTFNDGEPCFFLTLKQGDELYFLPIKFCPICGEQLKPVHWGGIHSGNIDWEDFSETLGEL